MASLDLGSDLGIETAAELKEKLQPALASAGPVVMSGGDVKRVHTAGLQLLAAFARSRQQAGHETRIDPCSDTLRDAAQLLGVAALLGLPGANP
jgi:ABC-type transporter Mla MlaB component